MSNTVHILGINFSKLTMDETVERISSQIDRDRKQLFHIITANPEIVMAAQSDPLIREAMDQAELITPDGIGIVIASRWMGEPVSERVAGYDLLLRLLEEGNRRNWSFYLLGSSEEVNKLAADIICEKYPNLIIAGRHHGFFQGQDEAVINRINEVRPDILVVALGAPRQEKWIYENKESLHTKVSIGVGGSLDVIAGKVKRAPELWQKLNLEWLYRLLSQPSRWRRQLALPLFAWKAYRESLSRKRHR